MSRVYSDTVLPEDSGVSQDQTLGTTGDSVVVTAGASLNVNTVKDAGGNTLFTSNGSGVLSSLNTAFTGLPSLITTNAFTDQSAVNFTASIDSTYKLYIFNIVNWNPSGDGSSLKVNFSTDGGSNYNATKTTTVFLVSHSDDDSTDTGTLAYQTGEDIAQGTGDQNIGMQVGSGADESAGGLLYLFNPSNTTFVKHFYSTVQLKHPHTASIEASWCQYTQGYLNTTSAINAVTFVTNAGTMTGTIKMYGL